MIRKLIDDRPGVRSHTPAAVERLFVGHPPDPVGKVGGRDVQRIGCLRNLLQDPTIRIDRDTDRRIGQLVDDV